MSGFADFYTGTVPISCRLNLIAYLMHQVYVRRGS